MKTRSPIVLALLLPLIVLAACATPKSSTELGKETVAGGLANSTRVQIPDGPVTQNSGSTPNSSGVVNGPDGKPRVVSAEPGPTDNFGLDSLGMALKLSNTVRMKDGEFTFALTDDPEGGKSATISGVKFAEFSTSPPETINALAGFQSAWNPAKIAENDAIKEAWNKAVTEWASTVRETLPALASEILKTFVVP